MEGLNPKNITVDQWDKAHRTRSYWLARNPRAFIENFIQQNWQEVETVQPPTPFYPKPGQAPLPVPQKDRVPPHILPKSPVRHQTHRPPVLPVPIQSVAPLRVMKPTPYCPQVEPIPGSSQISPRVILADQHWKEIRLSRAEDWILQTSGVVIPIQPIDLGSAATVAAPSIIGSPTTESVWGLFHNKPQIPAHILDLSTIVLTNLVNIQWNINSIKGRHTQELNVVILALKTMEEHLIHWGLEDPEPCLPHQEDLTWFLENRTIQLCNYIQDINSLMNPNLDNKIEALKNILDSDQRYKEYLAQWHNQWVLCV